MAGHYLHFLFCQSSWNIEILLVYEFLMDTAMASFILLESILYRSLCTFCESAFTWAFHLNVS